MASCLKRASIECFPHLYITQVVCRKVLILQVIFTTIYASSVVNLLQHFHFLVFYLNTSEFVILNVRAMLMICDQISKRSNSGSSRRVTILFLWCMSRDEGTGSFGVEVKHIHTTHKWLRSALGWQVQHQADNLLTQQRWEANPPTWS